MNLTTEAELAENVLHIDPARAADLRRQKGWPHVRLGRFDVRYTDEQVRTIVEMHTRLPEATTDAKVTGLPGQTGRSKRRSA
ncbi:MAG: hypothetical protein J7518_16555 [Nocardioidaceae bacterium]|nr:hypothetical protein [Nocardioidaceae bacterium]